MITTKQVRKQARKELSAIYNFFIAIFIIYLGILKYQPLSAEQQTILLTIIAVIVIKFLGEFGE